MLLVEWAAVLLLFELTDPAVRTAIARFQAEPTIAIITFSARGQAHAVQANELAAGIFRIDAVAGAVACERDPARLIRAADGVSATLRSARIVAGVGRWIAGTSTPRIAAAFAVRAATTDPRNTDTSLSRFAAALRLEIATDGSTTRLSIGGAAVASLAVALSGATAVDRTVFGRPRGAAGDAVGRANASATRPAAT
jgi:hypothetical protein